MLIDQMAFLEGGSNNIVGVTNEKTMTMIGTLVPVTGVNRWYVPNSMRISNIILRCISAPTGTGIIISINKNGSPIANSNFELAATETELIITPVQLVKTTAGEDDYFTVDVVSVGAAFAGADMSVQINYVTINDDEVLA
jgi:hypothetical protein